MSRSPDPFLLLGNAAAKAPSAPKGRKTIDQGKALGNRPTTNPSPEGAAQGWPVVPLGEIADIKSGITLPEKLGEANCSDLVLIQGPVLLKPYFAAYNMNSLGRRLVRAAKVDVAITHFHTHAVAAMPLPLLPLAEQHQIVAEVEARTTAIDHLEAELNQQISRGSRMQRGILSCAFSGALT
ncbi:MAG: hypothetical protein MUF31_06880 [Akkermansiaceae bacterium]|jgi:restriction endonuclease S subunit|nr:hypothetical protein [Akkermansiaceae bacterium]